MLAACTSALRVAFDLEAATRRSSLSFLAFVCAWGCVLVTALPVGAFRRVVRFFFFFFFFRVPYPDFLLLFFVQN